MLTAVHRAAETVRRLFASRATWLALLAMVVLVAGSCDRKPRADAGAARSDGGTAAGEGSSSASSTEGSAQEPGSLPSVSGSDTTSTGDTGASAPAPAPNASRPTALESGALAVTLDRNGDGVPDATTTTIPVPGGTVPSSLPSAPPVGGGPTPTTTTPAGGQSTTTTTPPTTTTAPPPASSFPNAANTGVPGGTVLTASGSMTINTPGTVVDAKDVRGSISINADNVTVKRTKVRGSEFALIWVKEGVTGVRVENCDLDGMGLAGEENSMGVIGPATVLRSDIQGVENGVTPFSGSLVEDNWIHDLGAPGAPHYDGIQIDGGVDHIVIRHNTVDNPHDQTSAVMVDNFFGPVDDVLVENNRLLGGGYSVYSDGQFDGGPITNVTFVGNRLGRGYWGYASIQNNTPGWSGNVDDASGATVLRQ